MTMAIALLGWWAALPTFYYHRMVFVVFSGRSLAGQKSITHPVLPLHLRGCLFGRLGATLFTVNHLDDGHSSTHNPETLLAPGGCPGALTLGANRLSAFKMSASGLACIVSARSAFSAVPCLKWGKAFRVKDSSFEGPNNVWLWEIRLPFDNESKWPMLSVGDKYLTKSICYFSSVISTLRQEEDCPN